MEENATSSRREEERDLRAALQYAVDKICAQEEAHDDDSTTRETTAKMSPSAVKALAELTYQYATTSLSNDLVWFARHANRRTITVDDVKLVTRKNPNDLLSHLESFSEQQKLARGVHTMKAVEKERNQKPNSPKKRRRRRPKTTKPNRKKLEPDPDEIRRKKTRARILEEIDCSDSSEESEAKYKDQEIDLETSDSNSNDSLEQRLQQMKSVTSTKNVRSELKTDEFIDNSDSSESIERGTSGLKRLKKGATGNRESNHSRIAASANAAKDDSLSDSDSFAFRETENKENLATTQSSVEVVDVRSQSFEY